MDTREEISQSMEPLFREAREKGLWFYSTYQQLWFSPLELEEKQARGEFVWGAVNWKLRDPAEEVRAMEVRVASLKASISRFRERMERSLGEA